MVVLKNNFLHSCLIGLFLTNIALLFGSCGRDDYFEVGEVEIEVSDVLNINDTLIWYHSFNPERKNEFAICEITIWKKFHNQGDLCEKEKKCFYDGCKGATDSIISFNSNIEPILLDSSSDYKILQKWDVISGEKGDTLKDANDRIFRSQKKLSDSIISSYNINYASCDSHDAPMRFNILIQKKKLIEDKFIEIRIITSKKEQLIRSKRIDSLKV